MKRRRLLTCGGTLGLASLSGCLGLAGLAEHEATPAGVDPAAREETGYERTDVRELAVEETFEVAFYSETIVARNYLTELEKDVDLGPLGSQRAAIFTALTTPQVSVLGREFNPVEGMSTRELVELIASNYDDVRNVSHEADETVEILGQETTASRFSADAAFGGQDLEVTMYVSEAVEAGEDWLVSIGVYPRQLGSREEGNVIALMEAITEDVDSSASDAGDSTNSTDSTDSSDSSDSSDETGGENGTDGDGGDSSGSDDGLLRL